jgi:hypothetical protein
VVFVLTVRQLVLNLVKSKKIKNFTIVNDGDLVCLVVDARLELDIPIEKFAELTSGFSVKCKNVEKEFHRYIAENFPKKFNMIGEFKMFYL